MNERKTERVARALCHAAATSILPHCSVCEHDGYKHLAGECILWYTFEKEAQVAIKAMKGF